ncbi:MAG TPA: cupin domain-containing protein [Ohtaekwangia sp.]|uniref:cupin domain-containing protein n=1 Tax=Ohtaekwangia sp. TaxID=2066019 RepID=UPI002F95D318
MKPASYWIDHLQLLPHPEGGFYKETYRAAELISAAGLPTRFTAPRNFSTAIYFLLRSHDRSVFHRIKSDELWHYHAGASLTIYILKDGGLKTFVLGADLEKGESLQVVVPANCWFGAKVNEENSYTLSGCTVAPGFDFADFELADRNTLLKTFPACSNIIELLTN